MKRGLGAALLSALVPGCGSDAAPAPQAGAAGAAGAAVGAGGGADSGGVSAAQAGQGGAGGPDSGGAGVAGASGFPGVGSDLPATKEHYLSLLERLADTLVATQITDKNSSDYGALVSPSTNPDLHPTYSRAAEAVYPLAVAYKHDRNEKYKVAAIALGNWLIGLQQASGAWGEAWPNHDGWDATTSDQLISLAGAYAILGPELSSTESVRWSASITRAADWIQSHFPKGVINYIPTGAVSLVLAHRAVPAPSLVISSASRPKRAESGR